MVNDSTPAPRPPHPEDLNDTPRDIGLRRGASPERKAFASVELSLRATLASLQQVRECWDGSSADRRKAMAADVEADACELGDAAHELRRLMWEIVQGRLDVGDD